MFPLVDAAVIRRFVGAAAFDRARPYARGGAVLELSWDLDSRRLTAEVQGNESTPYRCHIILEPARMGYYEPVDSRCSCHVGYDCKHVAATLLKSNAEQVVQMAGELRPDLPERPPEEPAWRATMAALTRAETPPTEEEPRGVRFPAMNPTQPAAAPLALQFELREPVRRSNGRWGHTSTALVAASVGATSGVRVAVRPVVRSSSGRWVTSNVGWGSLQYQVNRLNLDDRQVRWFTQFAALARAAQPVYLGQDQERLTLDEFPSPLLWHLLGEAKRLGIQLISNKKDGAIVVADSASISLDAASGGNGGGIRLETTVEFSGQDAAAAAGPAASDTTSGQAASVGTIGDHGFYTVSWSPGPTITLAPSTEPITAEHRKLLKDSELIIPAQDVDAFFDEFYPTLRQRVPIRSVDASVHLPEIVPPVLVLTARFEPKHVLRLGWEWEYAGASATRVPLTRRADAAVSHASVVRDVQFEDDVLAALTALLAINPYAPPGLLSPTGQNGSAEHTLNGIAAAEFTEHTLPAIEGVAGVRVDIVGKRRDYRERTEPPTLTVSTVETDQRDWFDLGVLVHVGDKSVPFGPLFTALAKGQKKLLLIDNSYLSLAQPVFDRLKELISEAQTLAEWQTGPRISRYQASLWADFEDLADQSQPATAWRESVGGLLELMAAGVDAGAGAGLGVSPGRETIAVPPGVNATLRPYQQDGYAWLTFLWRHELGGILADDMGLGKTLQTLALIAHTRAVASEGDASPPKTVDSNSSRPFLVVAPTSVVSNWVAEAARFTPGLRVASVTKTQAKNKAPLADGWVGADIVVTSYTLFRLDFEAYQAHEWAGLVLDEAQFVKNHASRAHQAARDLRAPFKLAVTGTPMENNLMELWSLLAIVAPGLFPSSRRFAEDYVRPIAAASSAAQATPAKHGAELLARLRRRIRPLIMRRTKELVAPELPPKQEQVLQIELAPRHRKLYDTYLQRERQKLFGLLDDLDKNRFIVFRSLTLLRMLSLDASLIDDEYASVPSSKLDALFEQLDDVLAEGHRALIFSQFTSFLGKAAARLDAAGVDYAYLDGSTRQRASVIAKFKDGAASVFLISLKAGGFGLNLTEADYVFMLDPWWNPATESQAVDRTHRIGQDKSVMVYRLVATGTIEEKVMALKEQKARLFDAVLDDDAVFSTALTAEDIRGLLEA